MFGLIGAALNAVTEGLRLANTLEAKKYIDELYSLKMDLLEQEKKGYDADDRYIEELYGKIKIALEAAGSMLKVVQASSGR